MACMPDSSFHLRLSAFKKKRWIVVALAVVCIVGIRTVFAMPEPALRFLTGAEIEAVSEVPAYAKIIEPIEQVGSFETVGVNEDGTVHTESLFVASNELSTDSQGRARIRQKLAVTPEDLRKSVDSRRSQRLAEMDYYDPSGVVMSSTEVAYGGSLDDMEAGGEGEVLMVQNGQPVWVNFEEALEQLTFKNAKNVLKKADGFLRENFG